MQQLTCRDCGTTWEREPKRGRPPVQCPDCKAGRPASKPQKKPGAKPGTKTPKNSPAAPAATDKVKRKRGKTAYDKLAPGVDNGPLDKLPLAQRTSGWCTDYQYGPYAVHDRCDGDLGKYRCPCSCHGWKDAA